MSKKRGMITYLVEIIIALVTVFIVYAFAGPALASYISTRNADLKSFDAFVDGLNKLPVGSQDTIVFPNVKSSGTLIFISKERTDIVKKVEAVEESGGTLKTEIKTETLPNTKKYLFFDLFNPSRDLQLNPLIFLKFLHSVPKVTVVFVSVGKD